MPISQDRFLNVLDGASALLDTHRTIRQLTLGASATISNANSVIEHTQDPYAKAVLQEILGTLHSINETILHSNDVNMELIGTVLAEQKYFNRAKHSNEKAKYYQRQKRREQNIIPRQIYEDQRTPPAPTYMAEPLVQPILQEETSWPINLPTIAEKPRYRTMEEIQAKLKAEGRLDTTVVVNDKIGTLPPDAYDTPLATPKEQTTPAATTNAEPASSKSEFIVQGDPDTKRHLPPLEELNAVPFAEGENVF